MELLPVTGVGVVLILWELLRSRQGRPIDGFDPLSRFRVAPSTLRAAIVLLPILFSVQLQLLHAQALHENGDSTAIFAALPIPVYIGRTYSPDAHQVYTAIAGITALAEAISLAIIAIGFGARPNTLTIVFAAAAAIAFGILGVNAPALSTTDPYDYLKALEAGWKTYRPDSGVPTAGWLYGPLWFWLAGAATSLGHSILEKVQALRALNVVFVAATVAALRYARLPAAAVWAFALNPGVWFECVANPHLEIWGLALVAAAYAFTVQSKLGSWLAMFALALAGAVKLPYLVLGAGSIASVAPLSRRFAALAGGASVALLVSWLFVGNVYFTDVAGFAQSRTGKVQGWNQGVRLAELSVAIGAAVWGFLRGRNFAGMCWLAPQFAPLPFPWYSNWGIAFSLDRARWLVILLATLPILDVFLDYNYDLHTWGWLWPVACAIACVWDLLGGARSRASASNLSVR